MTPQQHQRLHRQKTWSPLYQAWKGGHTSFTDQGFFRLRPYHLELEFKDHRRGFRALIFPISNSDLHIVADLEV